MAAFAEPALEQDPVSDTAPEAASAAVGRNGESTVPVPGPKLVETITFKWPDFYDEKDPFLPRAKQIKFSANFETPAGEQLIVMPEDMGNPIVLTRPFSLTKEGNSDGCYFASKTNEDGVVDEDDTKTRVYCYDRQPSNGRYFYAYFRVTQFFKQSTSNLVIQLQIHSPFISISAEDVTPPDNDA